MKKLIIHAGTYKTGSTALQYFLFDNERLLAEKGLGVFRPKWMYPLYLMVPDDTRESSPEHTAMFLRRHFAIENGSYEKYSTPVQERILKSDAHNIEDFKRFIQKHNNIVISAEGMYEAPKQYWEFVRRYSTKLGFDQVQVVVYLRRQDTYYSSLYRQDIQACNPMMRRISEAPTLKNRFFDYDACISDIEAGLGYESVVVRRYDRKCLVGGDIRRDFCDAIGIDWDERFILRDNVNPSISFDVAEVKRLANFSPSYRISDNFMAASCGQASKAVPDQPCERLLSSEEARQMMTIYEEGNRVISERFFNGEPLFDEVEDGIVGWERDTDRVLDASIVLLTEALAEQKKRIDRLERLLLIPQLRKVKRWLNRLRGQQ